MHDETAEDPAVGATRANLLVRAEAIGLVGPALSRLERLCSNPAGMDDALRLIRDEEMAHQRRANVIRRSVEVLVAAGFDASSTLGLPQDAALDALDRMEAMHERIRALEQRIALGLSGVNESARDRLLARLERIRSLDHVSELDDLDSEVAAARVAARTRRDGLLDRGRVLEGLGFRFDRQRLAALTEISALAARVETFETEVERRTEARDEIAEHAWDEALMAAWTNLESDAWWTLHEAHRTAWRASEMEAHARLEPWSAAGLDLERWVSGIEDDPDAVIEWEREHAAELAHAVGLIERLDALDVSVTGAEEVDAVVERLRMAPVDMEAQAHAQRTIEGFERRAARHLRMLMTSWHDLVARNLASRDAPIHTWTLARFEDELSNRMRTRTEVKSRLHGPDVPRSRTMDTCGIRYDPPRAGIEGGSDGHRLGVVEHPSRGRGSCPTRPSADALAPRPIRGGPPARATGPEATTTIGGASGLHTGPDPNPRWDAGERRGMDALAAT